MLVSERILAESPRLLPRQRYPQDDRGEIRHHHESAQLHTIPHAACAVLALDGSHFPRYAQDSDQCVLYVGPAWVDGPDQLCHREGGHRRFDEDGSV